jgi:hypothetical protein
MVGLSWKAKLLRLERMVYGEDGSIRAAVGSEAWLSFVRLREGAIAEARKHDPEDVEPISRLLDRLVDRPAEPLEPEIEAEIERRLDVTAAEKGILAGGSADCRDLARGAAVFAFVVAREAAASRRPPREALVRILAGPEEAEA